MRRIVLLVRVGWPDDFPQKRDSGPHREEVKTCGRGSSLFSFLWMNGQIEDEKAADEIFHPQLSLKFSNKKLRC